MKRHLKGGSLASNHVMRLANTKCSQNGGSDWKTMLYARGPASYGSTYDKKRFRSFTKTGKFYDSQGKLNKRGGNRKSRARRSKSKRPNSRRSKSKRPNSRRRRPASSNNNVVKSLNRIRSHLSRTPNRIAKNIEKDIKDTALNVTRSAERNLKDLDRDLTNTLRQDIKRSGITAKRAMRKSNQKLKNRTKKLKKKKFI